MRRPTGQKVVRSASVILSTLAISVVGLLLWHTPPPPTPADRIERLPPDLFERPPLTDDITFATPAAVERRRQSLQRYVFGHKGIPDGMPVVARGVADSELEAGLTNLERIDQLTIALPLGFTSVAYHVIPRHGNRKLDRDRSTSPRAVAPVTHLTQSRCASATSSNVCPASIG